jgi:Uncharacterized protein conserved in bacteria (DUF2330)
MTARIGIFLAVLGSCSWQFASDPVQACCAVYRVGTPVVNADQTVIIVWDAATKTQHFIRQASFKSEADDFGFIVPSPTQPELEEAGDGAFPYLRRLTEPEQKSTGGGIGCTCSANPAALEDRHSLGVKVLEEKLVAGFNASVLETKSATALTQWLKDNGYAFSPEVEAWARPYIEAGWKFTALKVFRSKDASTKTDVKASALRISFKTDRPVFPYREPDYKGSAAAVGAKDRLLRIYFLAEARYQGELTKETPWTGKVVWAGKLSADDRAKILDELKLPAKTGPVDFWLTEFEDHWQYKLMPADVYFKRAANQESVRRASVGGPSMYPTDGASYALAAVMILPPLWRRYRRAADRSRDRRSHAGT